MLMTRSAPRLVYARDGKGEPVVFSHALGCRMAMWDDIFPSLARTHAILRYDTRCHGASDVVTTSFTMADLVADAVRLLDEAGLDAVTWVGMSMGGMIGQGLAIAHPGRVRKLVLANTACRYAAEARALWHERARIARAEGMTALADLVMSRYFSPGFIERHPSDVDRFRRVVLETDPHGYAACCEAIGELNYYPALARIKCPTLVITSDSDIATPPAMAEEIVSRVENGRLEVIEGAGHLSVAERPDEFGELLRAFL
jgi:3-oxoadipate enol-lactonase